MCRSVKEIATAKHNERDKKTKCFSNYFSFSGLLPVSKESLDYLLSRTGVGNAVVIIIGGAEESLTSSPGLNTVVMKHRKGFVRLALKHG